MAALVLLSERPGTRIGSSAESSPPHRRPTAQRERAGERAHLGSCAAAAPMQVPDKTRMPPRTPLQGSRCVSRVGAAERLASGADDADGLAVVDATLSVGGAVLAPVGVGELEVDRVVLARREVVEGREGRGRDSAPPDEVGGESWALHSCQEHSARAHSDVRSRIGAGWLGERRKRRARARAASRSTSRSASSRKGVAAPVPSLASQVSTRSSECKCPAEEKRAAGSLAGGARPRLKAASHVKTVVELARHSEGRKT